MTSEIWKTALEALSANKIKALLTMLGVIIGSACLVLVVTVGLAGKRYILQQIEGIGANLVYAEHVAPAPRQARPIADEMSLADLQAVRDEIPEVIYAAGIHDTQITMAINGREHPASIVGVTKDYQRVRNLDIVRGRFLDDVDILTRAKGCVITVDLAKLLPYDNPVGQTIQVGELKFLIIGVFRERVATFGQSEITSETVIIPFPLIKYYTGDEFVKLLYAQANSADDVPMVTRRVGDVLEHRHRPGAIYKVQNLSGLLSAASNISNALTIVLLLIASVSLLISGVGIMNIMLVTVTQRTREIGVRMAIGARRREIEYQFLIEAFLISGTGAVVGIVIAIAVPLILQYIFLEGKVLPISGLSVIVSLVVSCGTGIVFGLLPARRASQMQPTEALRYE